MAGENQQERQRLAVTYASALYELAEHKGDLEAIRDQLLAWKDLILQNPDLLRVLDSVLIPVADRERLLKQIGTDFHPLLMTFLEVMNRRNRLDLIPEVIHAFESEDDRRTRRVRVRLWTASPVDQHIMDDIQKMLREHLGKEPVIDHRVRPDLIGGFVARADDLLIDGSVRTRLATLQKNLLRRGEDEIQSGRDFIRY